MGCLNFTGSPPPAKSRAAEIRPNPEFQKRGGIHTVVSEVEIWEECEEGVPDTSRCHRSVSSGFCADTVVTPIRPLLTHSGGTRRYQDTSLGTLPRILIQAGAPSTESPHDSNNKASLLNRLFWRWNINSTIENQRDPLRLNI